MTHRAALISVVLVLALSARARAQGPVYAAQPPTPGTLYSDGQAGRYLLGGTWLYRADLADLGVSQGLWRDQAATDGWTPVAVPNSYNAGDTSTTSMAGYVGWYRRDFTLPPGVFGRYVKAADRRWIVRFESVNYRAAVWCNGRRIGTHAGAHLPFELDLSNLRPGVNRLIVRVDNRRSPSDLPPGPGGGWWNYGGILGEVYLRAVQRVDLAQVQVRPLLPCPTCAASVQEQVLVRNLSGSRQTVDLTGRYGTVRLDFGQATIAAHGSWTAQASGVVNRPRLWSPDHPNLYRATLTLTDSLGRRLGGYATDSGIRSIAVTPGGRLTLNGRLLNLRGVNLHEQDVALGAALDPAHVARIIGWIRSLGATVIRAHYPLSPEIEQAADRDGILIWSEVPVYQVRSVYLEDPAWPSQAQSTLQQNILTNQNHPSVLLWSIGNELPTPADGPETHYIAAATALVHRLDPTRPVAMAVSGWPGVACQHAYAPLDVIGYNDYFGWYDAGGGSTDDRDALSPFLDSFRACYPTKAIFVTEFGFEGNRDGPVEERGTYQFQSNATAFHLGVFAGKSWLSGAIYFVLQDFAARPGWGGGDPWPDPPYVQKGVFDLQGNPRPLLETMSSIYRSTVQIAPARDLPSKNGRLAGTGSEVWLCLAGPTRMLEPCVCVRCSKAVG